MIIRTIVIALITVFCCNLPWPAAAMAGEKKVIIGFHKSPGDAEDRLVRHKRGKIKHKLKRMRALVASLPVEELATLKQDPNIAYIEEDVRIQAIDPIYAAEYDSAWGVQHIGSSLVHEAGNKGAGIKIAVLDTGLDYTHPEFQRTYQGGFDFVNNDADPMDDNFLAHGTHIAGIIASAQDGVGVVGVAPEAEIYAVKVIEGSGFGSLSHIVAGIEWAIDNQVDIINMALGFGTDDYQSLRQACESAEAAGILLVAAAGNSNGQPVQYPAAYDSVIAVNGLDETDQNAAFSAYGPEVELSAPGSAILSTVSNGEYSALYGTSQASAHVSGVAALLLSAGKAAGLGNHETRLYLQQSAVDLGELNRDSIFGFGRVDAAAAITALDQSAPGNTEDDSLKLQLNRVSQRKKDDAQSIILPAGKYLVTVNNDGLRKIRMRTRIDGACSQAQPRSIRFRTQGMQEKQRLLYLRGSENQVTFIPKGEFGTSAEITVTAIETVEHYLTQSSAQHRRLSDFQD